MTFVSVSGANALVIKPYMTAGQLRVLFLTPVIHRTYIEIRPEQNYVYFPCNGFAVTTLKYAPITRMMYIDL